MYLSKLELHGFKSFAERTVLQFDPGVTAIVGPNGCGKSNVVDAVRWVIGEQRARILRSEKMENVIFNGTAKRRPLGLGEVLLTVENTRGVLPTEYAEVTLGRRLYRSGESEYLLGGVPCRLKDITDLFMDTGMGAGAYSVIELKMIEEILSENAADRRRLFEEAAGITRYKHRRRQALGKLDTTQADLGRLRDLTDEIERRVRSLKRQARKAARYNELVAQRDERALALARWEHDRLGAAEQHLAAERQTLRDEADVHAARLAGHEADLERLQTRLVDEEGALSERSQRLSAHLETVRRLDADRRVAEERLHTARRDADRVRQEQEEADVRRGSLEETRGRLRTDVEAARPETERTSAVVEEARRAREQTEAEAAAQRQTLNDVHGRARQAEDVLVEQRRRVDRLASRIELLEAERDRAGAEAEEQRRAAAELEAELERAADEQRTALEGATATREALEEARREREAQRQALDAIDAALRQTERARDAAEAEVHLLRSLVASYEAFSGAVQFLAAAPEAADVRPPDGRTSELLTVADVLACDEEDRLALDAALGEWAGCVVVRTEGEVRRAIEKLRASEKGQASFVVLDRLPPAPPPPDVRETASADVDAPALRSRVRIADPAYHDLAALLLRDCYLAPSLEAAQALAATSKHRARYVAPSGEWADVRGFVQGGSQAAGPSPAGSRLGRREQLQEAEQTLAGHEGAMDVHQARLLEAQAALDAIPFEARRDALAEAERTLTEGEKAYTRRQYELETAQGQRDAATARVRELERDIEATLAEREALTQTTRNAEAALQTLQTARAEAEDAFRRAEEASREALQRFSDANLAALEARNRYDNLRRDLDRTSHALDELEAQTTSRTDRLAALGETIRAASEQHAALAEHIDRLHGDREGLEADVREAEDRRLHTRAAISDVEAALRKVRRSREEAVEAASERDVRLAEVRTRLANLLTSVEEDLGLDLTQADVRFEEDFDAEVARAELEEIKGEIRQVGSVNALALEEYEEEQERLDFLTAQQEDLESAEATLLRTIDEINATASRRFGETYEAIRANFARLFHDLFAGDAAADLQLADPDDPLESAIEIVARPRGKRPSGIAQLSGGEKTLTAIALLFAIYLVKPSPFCILDEVDAPLDDANVDRFMRLVRTFTESTQFILVTHNKRTMELADRLYGITMQEEGVSKLVGVQFDEALAMAG